MDKIIYIEQHFKKMRNLPSAASKQNIFFFVCELFDARERNTFLEFRGSKLKDATFFVLLNGCIKVSFRRCTYEHAHINDVLCQ